MTITFTQEKILKLVSVFVGLIITGMLLWFGFQFVQKGKAANIKPEDVQLTATSDSCAIQFVGPKNLTPVVLYGNDPAKMNLLAPASDVQDIGQDQALYKFAIISASTSTLYAKIQVSTDQIIDNSGVPFTCSQDNAAGVQGEITPTVAATTAPEPTVASTAATAAPKPTTAYKQCCRIDTNSDGKIDGSDSFIDGCDAFATIRCEIEKK